MKTTRRDLFRYAAIASAGIAAKGARADERPAESMAGGPVERRSKGRMGVIGIGERGKWLLRGFTAGEGVEVIALCDVVKDKFAAAQDIVQKSGQAKPATVYDNGDHAYEALARREDIDLIAIATPWKWHVPMATYAMKQGKHAAVEVPAAITLDGCWELVN